MNDLTINDVKIAVNEVLKNSEHIELAITKAFVQHDRQLKKDIEEMCKINLSLAIGDQEKNCGIVDIKKDIEKLKRGKITRNLFAVFGGIIGGFGGSHIPK